MRPLILFMLLLSLRAFGASSGTRIGDLPTTNAVAATNRLIVEIAGLGTNSTHTAELQNLFANNATIFAGSTNLLRFTNECYTTVIYGRDTNVTLAVSNAGLAAANGIYRTNLLNGYTQGIYKVAYSPSYGSFVISNATQQVYGFDGFGAVNIGEGILWSDDFLGNPPLPMSWWGSITVTNCFTVLASSAGLALPTVSSNLYVSETGNDTNALRGRIDKPWRNVQLALLATRPGDTVFVGAGSFPSLASHGMNYFVSNRVSLVGAGRGVTIIGTAGGSEEYLLCASEVVLRDFTFHGSPHMGASEMGITSTNCLIDSCEILATEDICHILSLQGELRINNVRGVTTFDGLADFDNRPGGSNRVIRITNSDFTLTNAAASHALRMLKGNDSRIEMFGGSLSFIGFASGQVNSLLHMDTDGSLTNHTGSILLSNVRIHRTATNATAQLVTNFLNRTPIFFDNCTPAITTPTLVSGSYTNGWFDRDIAFPNGAARTNRLVDTRGLTNALVAASEQGHRVTITDDGRTASGTNVYIYPSAGQTIIGQTWTNIVTDGGSLTLMIRGTNWVPVSIFP